MKKWILHILLVGMLGMHTTSCVTDDDLQADYPTKETLKSVDVELQFTLDMGGNSRGSSRAATWNDIINGSTDSNDNDVRVAGTDYENRILLNTLQVFLFDANGQYKGEVNGLTLNPSASSSTTYTFTGKVVVENATVTGSTLQNYTIMVVANNPSRIDGLVAVNQNHLFDYIAANYSPTATTINYIPMWGMLKTNIPLNEETAASYTLIDDPIFMLRSMAKIEVELSQDVIEKGYEIAGATLNMHNQRGYLLPALGTGITNYFAYTTTSGFDTESCFKPFASVSNTPIPFQATTAGDSCVIYVPEYDNDGTLEIQLDLENASGDNIASQLQSKGIIKVNTYSEGQPTNTPLDLIRNHWYCFTVGAVNDGTQLLLECVVQPWTDDQEILDYTRFVSFVGDGITVDRGNAVPDGNKNMSVYMTTEDITESYKVKVAEMTFTLQTPVGYTWYATLITDDKGMAYGFAQRDEDENLILDDDGKVATTAIASGEVGTTATLVIVSEHTGLLEAIQSRLQIVVRNENTGHTYVVQPDVMGGTYYIVQNP